MQTTRRLARVLVWRRRYPEALAMADRALALAPANLVVVLTKAQVYLEQGDLAGAQRVVHAVPADVEPAALVAFFANYDDLYWILDDDQQQLLLRLTPGQFDNNRASWAIVLAEVYALHGDQLAPARTPTRRASTSRRSCGRRRTTRSSTLSGVSCSPISAERTRPSARGSRAWS